MTLTSPKKDSLKKIKYLKIKHTATGDLSESFNKPTKDKKTQEVKFDLRGKESACFKLQLRKDDQQNPFYQQNVNSCGFELEVMRNTELVTVAKFDVDGDRIGELIHKGVLEENFSKSEKFQRIEVAYKVLKVQPSIENTAKKNLNPFSNGSKDEEIEMKSMNGSPSPCLEEGNDIRSRLLGREEAKFKPNSCIMVSFLSHTQIYLCQLNCNFGKLSSTIILLLSFFKTLPVRWWELLAEGRPPQ